MPDDDGIYVDAGLPATLNDGAVRTDAPTLQEAVVAWHRLPPERQQSATISAGDQVYDAHRINRLHYGPRPSDSAGPTRDGVPVSDSPSAGTAPSAISSEIPTIPRVNSAATVEVPTPGPLETSRGIPQVLLNSLASPGGPMVRSLSELTLTPAQAGSDSIQKILSDQPIAIAKAARALAEQVAAQITELQQAKPNDPGRLAQYDALLPFLEKLASGLGDLADALDRLAMPNESEPVLLGKASDIARWLQKTVTDWLETNRTMVIDVPVRLGLFGLAVAFAHQLGVDGTAVTASLAYLAGLRSTPPRN
jgi:hypothetical protein